MYNLPSLGSMSMCCKKDVFFSEREFRNRNMFHKHKNPEKESLNYFILLVVVSHKTYILTCCSCSGFLEVLKRIFVFLKELFDLSMFYSFIPES